MGVKIMGHVYFPDTHTPDEWRARATRSYDSVEESFRRSDTDGYLSQWANTVMGALYLLCAQIAERGGMWTFTVLADANGVEIEDAREVKTKYGWAWLLPDGRWFNPSRAQNEDRQKATDLAKGFQLIEVDKPAVVVMQSHEGGLGCSPAAIPRRQEQRA